MLVGNLNTVVTGYTTYPLIREIHGTGLMTEKYSPTNQCSRTDQNIIKILIVL